MYVINSHRKKEEPFNELTIDTRLAGSASNTFILPLRLIDHVNVDWGDGVKEDYYESHVNVAHTYNTPGIYTIKMYGTGAQIFRFFNDMDRRKVISGVIGNTGWTNFSYTFWGCSSLTTLDVSSWDVSSVTSFYAAFQGCSSLTTLDVSNWNVSSVINFGNAFTSCSSLAALDVSGWDVSSVLNFVNAFASCSSLTTLDVSNWDVSSVTTFSSAFRDCSSLTTLDVSAWNVSSVTTFRNAFYGCYSLLALDVSNWNVSSVTTFRSAFYNCSNLALFDASAWVMSANLIPESYIETFKNCGTLDLKIGPGWNFSALTEEHSAWTFLQNTNIGSINYDYMLSIIASQPLNDNVTFGGGFSKYTAAGKVHRDAIEASYGWTFNDGGLAT